MRKAFFFSFFMIFLCIFCTAAAQDDEIITLTLGDWEAVENDSGLTLTAYLGTGDEIEIPEILEEKPVTRLGKELFKNRSELKRVVIPDSVKVMEANIFNGCTSLTDVRLPAAVTKIDTGTFRYCISLEHIDIPFSVTVIGAYAFADCIRLKEVLLISVTSIGESAFDNCQMLDSVTMSRKIATVGGNAFQDTPWLESQADEFVTVGKGVLIRYNGSDREVEIPYGTTMIAGAFDGNYQIESVVIPETVLQIGQYAFRNAVNLKELELPPLVTGIASGAFDGCRSLSSLELPDTLKTLEARAFANCNALQHMTIPPLVATLPNSVFADCPGLTDVFIPDTVKTIHDKAFDRSPNVRLQVTYGSAAESYAMDHELLFAYSIQENSDFKYSQDEVGTHILRYVGKLNDVEIPAEINGIPVVSIEAGAFRNVDFVRRITTQLPLKRIGDWAFSYMPALREVKLSAGMESIGMNAFTGSLALKEIRLPVGLDTVGNSPFDMDAPTMICAEESSDAAQQLRNMGYIVHPLEECSEDAELLSLMAELYSLENVSEACDCSVLVQADSFNQYSVIRITDGTAAMTAEMLENEGKNLVLIIPSSVVRIDPEILDDHLLISIVSEKGTEAENFARENRIRFLMTYENILILQ